MMLLVAHSTIQWVTISAFL